MTGTTCSPGAPMAPEQPHAAVILLWYPLFTQPFIFREVENLANTMPLQIYTLYGSNLRHCSAEMRQAAHKARSHGIGALPRICWEMGKYALRRPRKFFKLLRNSLGHRWPNLETFGENLWAFATAFTLAREFLEDGIDVILAPWPRGTATAASVVSSLTGIPFVMAVRGDNLDPADPDLGAKMAAATRLRANNKADLERIENFSQGNGKTTLIYNSLTLPEPLPAQRFQHDRLRLLALGRFDVTKGFDLLLRACAFLKEEGIPFHLTLAGGGGKFFGLGDLEKSLRQLRKDLRLENETSMPGLVSHDELPQLMAQHDIFVAPCVIHVSGRRDGIPNTVIEALAQGLPVVSSNVHALPEVVQHGRTGFAVEPTPRAIADAIKTMACHPGEALEMAHNGMVLVRGMFDTQANGQKLAALLRDADREGRVCAP